MDGERSFSLKNGTKVHFNIEWLPVEEYRKMTVCVIETKAHKFYSGVAVRAPNDEFDLRTGRQVSLKRACEAMCHIKFGAHWYYKNAWSEIRAQLRQEREEKNVKQ